VTYEPQEWRDGPAGGTPITAERLNHIEQGVKGIADEIAGRLSEGSLKDTFVQGKTRPGGGTYTAGDVVCIGVGAHVTASAIATAYVQGGSPNYENVIGGNPANVSTPTSLLTGAPALSGEDGNWSAILHGYDNVNNGWANIVSGFHQIAHAGSNHATVCGGASQRVAGTSNYGVAVGGLRNEIDGTGSVIVGGEENTATANHAVVTGGYRNDATGVQSFVGGGTNNNATHTVSFVGGGANNNATNNYATIAGGQNNTASGNGAFIGAGNGNTASQAQAFTGSGLQNVNNGQYGFVGSGYQNNNQANYGAILGGRENEISAAATYGTALGRNAKADFFGAFAQSNGAFAAPGDAQSVRAILRHQTTTATPTDLRLDGANHRPIPAVNTTWAVTGTVVARRTDGGATESAAWKVEATFARDTGMAVPVGTPTITALNGQTPPAGWELAVGIDSATGGLSVKATGADGATIRWVASLEIVQVQG